MKRFASHLSSLFRSRGLHFRVLLLTFVISNLIVGIVSADSGEFWDAGVASMMNTKRIHRSHFQFKAGAAVLHDVDRMQEPPADARFISEGYFYGFGIARYEHLFGVYANMGLGSHDGRWKLDGYQARLSVYSYLNGGLLTLGSLFCEQEKALNEKFVATTHPFEYGAGGGMKIFVLVVNAKAFGYEFRRYYSKDDYHGLQLFHMNIKAGLVFGKRKPVSFETSLATSLATSWKKRKDFTTAFEMVLHWNNRVAPMNLSAKAEHRYASDNREKNALTDFHDSYYTASALLGVRF